MNNTTNLLERAEKALGFAVDFGKDINFHLWREIRDTRIAIQDELSSTEALHNAPDAVLDNFSNYLLDNCKGEMVTVENVQRWLFDMAKHPGYARKDV